VAEGRGGGGEQVLCVGKDIQISNQRSVGLRGKCVKVAQGYRKGLWLREGKNASIITCKKPHKGEREKLGGG